MEKKMKKESDQIVKILTAILYAIVFLGVSAIIILRFVGVIKQFDIEYIYLLLLVSALALIPQFKKISIGEFSLEKETSTMEEAGKDVKKAVAEEQAEDLGKQLKKKVTWKDSEEIKRKLLEAYCNDNCISNKDFYENRQIFCTGDPINNDNPVFMWYLNKYSKECLIEAKFTEINKAYYNKLYVMLSKIISYNKINCKNLQLVLLVQRMNKEKIGVTQILINSLKNVFKPAIDSKLLEIEEFEL